ncbi:MAG: hypothetical protein JXN62_10960 [Bacteroidales bacterium]|nr:hypothetical protein [Bacteroidales bacterium]
MKRTLADDVYEIAASLRRDQLPMHEYGFLGDMVIKEYFISTGVKNLDKDSTFSLAATVNGRIAGYISCSRNDFDSDIFGFSCFNINDLIVLENAREKTGEIVRLLLKGMENILTARSRPTYYLISLNNNTGDCDKIFNTLSGEGCYYVHTLLTFVSYSENEKNRVSGKNDDIIIRTAGKKDAEEVATIARSAFRLSRFHMDPFLDNSRADLLHFVSARNSLLGDFTDIMFVAEKDKRIIGYYSGKKNYYRELGKTIGKAVISAVSDKFRGYGVFNKLDDALLNWFSENTDFAEMGTYLVNYPVHRTWITKGLPLIRGIHQFSKFIR